jgi:hypothetical protein
VKPLLHFLVLGALLFGARQLTSDGRSLGLGAEPIVIAAAEVERLRLDWVAETRRQPSRHELEASIRRAADEETLLREALRLGLDRTDPVVRMRLVQNMRFARGQENGSESFSPEKNGSESFFLEAIALDMARRDVLARRRLVQVMEERLSARAAVSEAEVRAFIAAHPERYRPRPRITFDQVFIPADPASRALLPGARVARQSEADLARTFGADFARAALAATPGEWAGPIRSAYGLHVIRVDAVDAGRADDAAVLRQAWYALLEERERAAARAGIAGLRRAYPVRIEWPALALADLR